MLAEESRNNLVWAALHRAEQRLPDDPGYTFLTFDACGSWSAHAFIKQDDRHLVMGVMSDRQLEALVDFLGDGEDQLRVLEGPMDTVLGFVERWREIADGSPEVQMKQGL